MKIKSHSESHIVALDDGSKWKVFPGNLDRTLDWTSETDLELEETVDEVSSHALVSTGSGHRVRVIHADESWPVQQVKNVLKEG